MKGGAPQGWRRPFPEGPEIAQLLDELHLVRHSLIEAARALERINQTVSSLMNGGQAPPGCAGRRGR